MIEDNIRMLRQAAVATSSETFEVDKAWGIVAGNVDLVDGMAYKAIASNHQIKILFREHVILTDGKVDKKFDFIMFYGNSIKLNEFKLQESQTTGFIDIDISNEVKLPNFIKSLFKPFYNANEVVLSTVLLSVERKEAVNKVQSIATSNKVFVIDFRDIVTEDLS